MRRNEGGRKRKRERIEMTALMRGEVEKMA